MSDKCHNCHGGCTGHHHYVFPLVITQNHEAIADLGYGYGGYGGFEPNIKKYLSMIIDVSDDVSHVIVCYDSSIF